MTFFKKQRCSRISTSQTLHTKCILIKGEKIKISRSNRSTYRINKMTFSTLAARTSVSVMHGDTKINYALSRHYSHAISQYLSSSCCTLK